MKPTDNVLNALLKKLCQTTFMIYGDLLEKECQRLAMKCGSKKNRKCNANTRRWNSTVKDEIQKKKEAHKEIKKNPT